MTEPAAHRGPVRRVGGSVLGLAGYVGGMTALLCQACGWTARGLLSRRVRFGWANLAAQCVRVGVKSLGIVCGVQFFLGVILALQLAPQFESFGFLAAIANVIGYSVFRELGPLLTAVVLSGFAGASIAAEIGTMVVSEEVEALEAHAINPVRFLVVPRLAATVAMMICLTVLADLAACAGGYLTARLVLGPAAYLNYWDSIAVQLNNFDFFTGLFKAAGFGLLIGLIACYEGLKVRGGAEGVGRATTMTVVYSIVSLIGVDCLFTIVFYIHEHRLRDWLGI